MLLFNELERAKNHLPKVKTLRVVERKKKYNNITIDINFANGVVERP